MVCNRNWSCIGGELQLISLLGQLSLISSWQWSIESLRGGVPGSVPRLAYGTTSQMSNLLRRVLALVPKQRLERNSASLKGQELTEAQRSLSLFEKAAYPFLSTGLHPTTVKSLGSFPSFPTNAHLKSLWLSRLSKKIPTSTTWSKILGCICCSLWVGSRFSLCARATCKCFLIDDPLLTDLVNKSETARRKKKTTRSMALAMYLWQWGTTSIWNGSYLTSYRYSAIRAGIRKMAQWDRQPVFWGGWRDIEKHAGDYMELSCSLAFRCSLASSRNSSPSQSSHQPLNTRHRWRTDLHALFFYMCFIFWR